jgi:hypothetical protein
MKLALKLPAKLLLFVSLFVLAFYPAGASGALYLVTVDTSKLPAGVKTFDAHGYWMGRMLDLSEGWSLLSDDAVDLYECESVSRANQVFACSVVITQNAIPVFQDDGKTVRNLEVDLQEPCLWYDLTLSIHPGCISDNQESCYTWDVKPVAKAQRSKRLLDKTLLIVADPKLFEGIKDTNHSSVPGIISLPALICRDGLDAKTVRKAFDISRLCALGLDAVHSPENPLSADASQASLFMKKVHPTTLTLE